MKWHSEPKLNPLVRFLVPFLFRRLPFAVLWGTPACLVAGLICGLRGVWVALLLSLLGPEIIFLRYRFFPRRLLPPCANGRCRTRQYKYEGMSGCGFAEDDDTELYRCQCRDRYLYRPCIFYRRSGDDWVPYKQYRKGHGWGRPDPWQRSRP